MMSLPTLQQSALRCRTSAETSAAVSASKHLTLGSSRGGTMLAPVCTLRRSISRAASRCRLSTITRMHPGGRRAVTCDAEDKPDIPTLTPDSGDSLLYEEQLERSKKTTATTETFTHVRQPGETVEGLEELRMGEYKRRLVVAVGDLKDNSGACKFMIDNICREGDIVHLLHVVPFEEVSTYEPVIVLSDDDPHHTVCVPDPRSAMEAITMGEPMFIVVTPDPVLKDYVVEFTEKMLDTLGDEFLKAKIAVECDVVVEKTNEAVCKVIEEKVEELDASMLVLSTEKASGVEAFLFGSVSGYCVRHCKCPVVVLHRV